jgi:hypothetical protein
MLGTAAVATESNTIRVGDPAMQQATLTRIAATESAMLCVRRKRWLRFWNWKRQFEAAPCELFLCECVLEGNVQKETVGSS